MGIFVGTDYRNKNTNRVYTVKRVTLKSKKVVLTSEHTPTDIEVPWDTFIKLYEKV